MDLEEKLHIEASDYATLRREAYRDGVKAGKLAPASDEILQWVWLAHYEGFKQGRKSMEQK